MPHVYLVQPVELVGTNRYKIGMSSLSNLSRVRSYKNGTRYLCIFEKQNALDIERRLKQAFNRKYKLIGGNEYFEVDNEQDMVDLFVATTMGYTIASPSKKVIESSVAIESDCIEPPESKTIHPTNWIKKYAFGG